MRKNIARKLAMLLALVVLVTTCGSDYNSISVRATSEEAVTDSDEQANSTEDNDYSSLFTEGIGDEQPAETEDVSEEPAVEETAPEENVEPEEAPAEEPQETVQEETTEETPAEEAAPAEENADAPAEEAAPEEAAPTEETPAEAPAEETPAEAVEAPAEETPAETVEAPAEVRNVTVTYTATKGGKVSRDSETIDLNVEGAAFEGATATARSDKYEFVNWTDAEGNEVSSEATFVPANIEADATFTANFKAAENIAEDMPALSVTDVHAGGLIVSISAEEGIFPKDTEVSITGISDDQAITTAQGKLGEDVKAAKGVDITFNYEGKEIQPADDRYVHVELKLDEVLEGDSFTVLHDHDGDVETINADIKTEDANQDAGDDTKIATEVSFDSNQFSVYIVVSEGEEDENARLNVKFVNGETEIASVYVKKNDLVAGDDGVVHFDDIVYDPGVGELDEGVMFRGWTQNADYDTKTPELDIDGVRTEVKEMLNEGVAEGASITYYAMLFKAYNVSYLDDRNASLGSSEIKFRADDSAEYQKYTVDMFYNPGDEEHAFAGWLVHEGTTNIKGYTEGQNYPNETEIEIKGNVVFSVNAPAGHWLVFNENGKGATYNAPVFLKTNETTTEPETAMNRLGYTFGGWYDSKANADAHGNNPSVTTGKFVFGNTISDKTTVYASWIPATNSNYTILIWKQNITADGYDYEEAINLTGRTGTTVNTVVQRGTGDGAYVVIDGTEKKYTGFHLKSYTKNVTITPEGTAVVNVYYDRNEYTFTFQANKNKRFDHVGDGVYVASTPRTTIYTVKRLYDQDISDIWEFTGSDGVKYPETSPVTSWTPSGSSTYTQRITRMERMPAENITFALTHTNKTTRYFHYYIEAPEGATGTRTYKGKNYILYKDLPNDFYRVYYNDDFWILKGYTREAIAKSDDSTVNLAPGGYKTWDQLNGGSGDKDNLYFYYTRNKYSINYMDGGYFDGNGNPIDETNRGQLGTEKNIKYEEDLSSYNKDGEHYFKPTYSTYVFEGWYMDEACTQQYTFTTMPLEGITVYAKWRLIQYRVFLHPMAGTDSTLNWGSEDQAMNFRISCGSTVSVPNKALRSGYEFAGWYRDPEYKLGFNAEAFVLNETTVKAEYNKATDLTDPMDKWGNGATTNADVDRPWITKKLDLYARWRLTLPGATGIGIVYDAAGGSPAPSDTNLYADTAMAAAGAAPTTTPDIEEGGKTYESRFSHWVVQAWNETADSYEDTDVTVLPGATFEVKKADARVQDLPDDKKSYTIQLRAEYVKVEKSVPTHITWYNNYDGGLYRTDEDLEVNASVPVYGLGEDESIPQRAGYIFKGWAREEESVGTTTDSKTLFITYDSTTGYSDAKVAADEKAPYHALYAVWEAKKLVITIVGNSDTKAYNGTEQSVTGIKSITIKDEDGNDVEGVTPDQITLADGSSIDSVSASGTNVGTYNMGLPNTSFKLNNENFADVDWVVTDGTLEITQLKVKVTIKGHTSSVDYDGQEHTVTGYDFSSDNALYTEDKVSFSGTDEATRTEHGKTEMGLKDSDFTNDDTTNFDVTFDITDGYQEINKLAVTVTITGHNDTKQYNGSEQSVQDYDVSISNDLYKEEDFSFNGTASASRTDEGTTYMLLKDPAEEGGAEGSKFTNNNENFDVTFDITDGYITITPVSDKVTVTITGHKLEKDYTGETFSVEGYDVSIDNESYTEADFRMKADLTTKLESADVCDLSMGLTSDCFENINDNFKDVDFIVTDGSLKINPAKVTVTITGNTDSKVYNGQEQSIEGYDVQISNQLYTESDFTFSEDKAEAKGTDVGTYPMNLKEDGTQFTNTNDNFEVTFSVTNGELEITKLAVTVTITGETDSKVYNGQEQSIEGYDVQISDERYTESDFTFSEDKAEAKGTDAGTYPMNLKTDGSQFTNTNDNFDVTFDVTNGELEITPVTSEITVEITGNNDSKPYNGGEQKVEGYTVKITDASNLYKEDDIEFTGEAIAKGTDVKRDAEGKVDKYPMNLSESQFSNKNTKNFTNVTFSVEDGYLEITPVEVTVTITGHNDTVTYDGEEHAVNGYEVEISDDNYTKNDFTFSGNDSIAETEVKRTEDGAVDKYMMGLSKDDFTNTNDNYDVTFEIAEDGDGFLQINPITATVQIKGDHVEAVYDGEDHTAEGWTVEAKSSDLVNVDSIDLVDKEAKVTAKDVKRKEDGSIDKYMMGLTADDFKYNSTSIDVTFEVVDGYVLITPVETVVVTITGAKETAEFDTTEYKAVGYEVSSTDSNYTEADFEFDPTGLTLDDGKPAVIESHVNRDEEGNVIPYPMGLKEDGTQFKNTNPNYDKVQFNVTDGSLTITPVSVTVTIKGHTEVVPYNGQEQTVSGYDIEVDSTFLNKEEIQFDGTDEVTKTDVNRDSEGKVIPYPMGLTEDMFSCENGDFDIAYSITDGSLTITPHKVKVDVIGNNYETMYDGTEKKAIGYTINPLDGEASSGAVISGEETSSSSVDVKSLFDETKVVYTPDETIVMDEETKKPAAVGTLANSDNKEFPEKYPMNLAASQFSYDDPNLDVTFEVSEDGWLKINDRIGGDQYKLRAITDDETRVYSGHTYVGSEFAYRLEEDKGPIEKALNAAVDVAKNVLIYLNVLEAEPEVTGSAVTVNGVEYSVSGLAVDVSARNVGDYALAITGEETFVVLDKDGNDVTRQFAKPITKDEGTLKITPMNIELISASDEKVYDGSPLTNHNVTANPGWVDGDKVTYNFTGSQTEEGSSQNLFTAVADKVVLDNYNITYTYGTLKVTKPSESNPPEDPKDDDTKKDKKKKKTPTTPKKRNDEGDGTNDNSSNGNGNVLGAKRSAEDPAVLGAKRGTGEGSAVLGARRGGTDDSTDTSRVIVLLIAAGAVATLLATGKKRRSHEE
ncbi:InlB B-repeat-containing protein [Butyrivibrio sp. JL13D10]|uniref:InlB B-repeat-containing protein n=1 Tax=Butyrivibrio sp. JL13D10 TaxID=3236815 RepID=UPI0038B448BD